MKDEVYSSRFLKYKCRECPRSWLMYLDAGIEDGKKAKTAPSPIRCSCGGLADRQGDQVQLMICRKLEKHESYFENQSGCRLGIPILRGKIHERNNKIEKNKV